VFKKLYNKSVYNDGAVIMKKTLIIIGLVIAILFLVAFPGISSLISTSQKREDLINYCKETSSLVDSELEMYDLYQKGEFTDVAQKAQVIGCELDGCQPQTKEIKEFSKRYHTVWDNWANDSVADLFGYGYDDNELIKYHEDILKMADELGIADSDLGKYSKANWEKEKLVIIKISKKYLLGND